MNTQQKLTSEQQKLALDNRGLVYSTFARKIQMTRKIKQSQDDILQEGFCGLLKAARTFNDNKGYTFSTYATQCIYNEMMQFIRKLQNSRVTNSLDAPIAKAKDDNDDICLMDVIPSDDWQNLDDQIDCEIMLEFIHEISNVLPSDMKQVLDDILSGKNRYEIAKELCLTRQAIDKKVKILIRKMNHIYQFHFLLGKFPKRCQYENDEDYLQALKKLYMHC